MKDYKNVKTFKRKKHKDKRYIETPDGQIAIMIGVFLTLIALVYFAITVASVDQPYTQDTVVLPE